MQIEYPQKHPTMSKSAQPIALIEMYMRAFAESWQDEAIVQQVAEQLSWGHNMVLLDKLSEQEARIWYAQKAIENNWSRNVLVVQIETRLIERQGNVVSNFEQRLPKPDSDLARESIKDPLKAKEDAVTIGLLLCKSKDKVVAEYALGDKSQPMGIAEYKLLESLPVHLQTQLHSIEDIERELQRFNGGDV
jgi:predicted nuclease of restriction endonuclease-like (RecB) superfamily